MKPIFTSGGTKGPKYNEAKYPIPESTNLYGIVESLIAKEELALIFYKHGWSVRKSSWVDFEVECEWAELTIEGDNEILINGLLAPDMFEELFQFLEQQQLKFSLEFYVDNELLEERVKN
jgi:hypothetical protein